MESSWVLVSGLLLGLGIMAGAIAGADGLHLEYPVGALGWLLIALSLWGAGLIVVWNGLTWPPTGRIV
jgi:hypothetical protein